MTAPVPYTLLIGILSALVGLLFAGSLLTGPAAIGFTDSLIALVSGQSSDAVVLVMREIRLPRAILGLMIGASLGLTGAALQGYLRNPLAEPALLGISASASLGAVLAIYTGLAAILPLSLPILALLAAIIAVFVVRLLAGSRSDVATLILAGLAVTSFAGAMTALALNLSPNPFAALEIVFWMLGSLADRSMADVWLASPFMLAGWMMIAGLGRALDALTLGEATARSLGIRLDRVQALAVFGTAVSVGAATSVSGAIGFIGLIVPHLMRPLVGARPSRLLLASALAGAAMLLAADIAVRLISPDTDLKIGVLTALVGAPFFLWLIIKTRRSVL